MRTKISLFLLTATTGLLSANPTTESVDIATLVKNAATANKLEVAEVVAKEVAANPNMACEIVKNAITASKADATVVAAIVESAILAAPEQMVSIPRCALTIAPDSNEELTSIISKYVATDASGKEIKSNPLDAPQNSASGQTGNVVGQAEGLGSSTAGPNAVSNTVADQAGGGNGAASTNPNAPANNIPTKPVSETQPPRRL
jgi:hypothetical protein